MTAMTKRGIQRRNDDILNEYSVPKFPSSSCLRERLVKQQFLNSGY